MVGDGRQRRDLRRLAWHATSPWDRARLIAGLAGANDSVESAFGTAWRARHGSDAWPRRLRAEGLVDADLRAAEMFDRWPEDLPLPSWVEAVSALVRAVTESATDRPGADAEVAFGDILRPAAGVIERTLDATSDVALLNAAARADRREGWVRSLSRASERVLARAFARWCHRHPLEHRIARRATADGPPRDRLYRRFATALRHDGLESLLEAHPLLARRLGQTVVQQRTCWATLLARLAVDLPALRRWVGAPPDARVDSISGPCSDPHDGGNVVVAIRLESTSCWIYYKPRSLLPEAVMAAGARWLDVRGASPGPAVPDALAREGYGWSRQVVHEALPDDAALAEYARRAGALLALSHVLSVTDLHADNLVATACGPVLVDVETLLMPAWRDAGARKASVAARLDESVLRTRLLPEWEPDHDGEAVDVSGLAGFTESVRPIVVRRIADANTDRMRWIEASEEMPPARNRVLVDGAVVAPGAMREDLVAGFRHAYGALRDDPVGFEGAVRASLGDDAGSERGELRIRFLFRPTLAYDQILDHLGSPALLRDAEATALELDRLMVPFLNRASDDPVWPTLVAERAALEHGDVPRFELGVAERGSQSLVRRSGGPTGGRWR